MKKLFMTLAVMFTLSFGAFMNNPVSANVSAGCVDFTLSCGVTGVYCPAQNQSVQSMVNDILWLDDVICG